MNKRILIVEDEIVLQEAYRLMLDARGYLVYTANNGAEGIRQLRAVRPDMVLLDLFMPVMDGKEFLRNTDTRNYPHTKFVVYTNVSDSATEMEMLALGAHRVILKSSMAPQDLLDLATELTG